MGKILNKLIIFLLLVIFLSLKISATQGNDTSGNEIRYATGYITINSTGSNENIQSFGDFISGIFNLETIGWLSQLTYNFFSPLAPDLESPPNNTYYNFTPEFYWSNTSDPDLLPVSYLFEIWNNSALTEIHYTNYSIAETQNTTSAIPIMNTDGIYYWRVAANDTSKNSSFSELRAITLDTTLPGDFNLTSPADRASSTDTSPILQWDSPSEINLENYTIELSLTDNFLVISQTEYSNSNSLNNWSSPLGKGTYYWKVRATDKANNHKESNFSSFIVQASETTTVVSGTTGTTTSGGGTKPFTLNIIAPEGITTYKNDIVKVPLLVINPSNVLLRGIRLNVGSDEPSIIPNIDIPYLPELSPQSQQKIMLTINTQNVPIGSYGITIDASIVSPVYKDTFKVFTNVLEKDTAGTSEVKDRFDFAKQLFTGNPECLDLSEYISEAELAITNNQNDKALSLVENAIDACNKLLAQRASFSVVTGQTTFINRVMSQFKSRTLIIVSSEVLSFLILLIIIVHFVRKKRRKY